MSTAADQTICKSLETINLASWEGPIDKALQKRSIEALEEGKVLYLPALDFPLGLKERTFLTEAILAAKSKNISFNSSTGQLKGAINQPATTGLLKVMLQRYAQSSSQLLKSLLPHYSSEIIVGKTSFRPAEVEGRKTSYRKDDTRLHVDAFPSNPTQGLRILRVFTNVNPEGKPRVWRLGEPLNDVMQKFLPKAAAPTWGVATLLKLLGITKEYRTAYDHYMLQIHDRMKEDTDYQKQACYEEVAFPPGTSWIVYTDQVSHAAMSGQHLFEQTFYLPVQALKDPETSPLKVLERLLNKKLI